MLSAPSWSARRHASRSSAMVHCCGWIVTPTLNRLGSLVVAPWAFCMDAELIPHEVDLASADPDFWRRYHVFRRIRHAENRPDDPLLPDYLEEKRLIASLKFEINACFEVVDKGEIVGWLRTAVTRPGAPGYEENRDFFWCFGSVVEPYRRRGIASSWLPIVVELMDRFGCRVVTFDSEEESGHAFMKWL